jgi:GT2 family glycosyltransferase
MAPDTALDHVSVVVPTIGRLGLLRSCLRSIDRCRPRPGEVIVVDQSRAPGVERLVAREFASGFRVVADPIRSIGRAMNTGFAAARNDVVMATHDDCTVAPDWVGVASRYMGEHPDAMLTGSVVPEGDPRAVPSTVERPEAADYSDPGSFEELWPMNMAIDRRIVADIGGFDERLMPAAEDADICYRWLKAGRPVLYRPDLRVNHHEWRTPDELRRMYGGYARGMGLFYGKHLARGDRLVLHFIARDLGYGLQFAWEAIRWRDRPWWDWRQGLLTDLPLGLLEGWWRLRP